MADPWAIDPHRRGPTDLLLYTIKFCTSFVSIPNPYAQVNKSIQNSFLVNRGGGVGAEAKRKREGDGGGGGSGGGKEERKRALFLLPENGGKGGGEKTGRKEEGEAPVGKK